MKANQKSANSPRINIVTAHSPSHFSFSRTRTTELKCGGHSFTIQSFVPSPVKLMQVQNGFICDKERYLDSLKISDCRAFKPVRT